MFKAGLVPRNAWLVFHSETSTSSQQDENQIKLLWTIHRCQIHILWAASKLTFAPTDLGIVDRWKVSNGRPVDGIWSLRWRPWHYFRRRHCCKLYLDCQSFKFVNSSTIAQDTNTTVYTPGFQYQQPVTPLPRKSSLPISEEHIVVWVDCILFNSYSCYA